MLTSSRGGAPQRHVLADRCDCVGNGGLNGRLADLRSLDLLDIRAGMERNLGDHLDQTLELLVASDEVGLGIDFDDHALVAGRHSANQAVGGNTAGLFRSLRQALLAQPILRCLHIAFGLGEGCLAIHHAGASGLAKVLDHRC